MNIFLKKLIESGVIIAIISSLFIMIGFISKFANNRVLGIYNSNIDTTSYIEQAGSFFLQSLQFFLKPTWYTNYIPFNFGLILLFIILIVIMISLKYMRIFKITLRRIKLFKIIFVYKNLISLLIILSFLIISTLFSSIVTVESVLQPKKIDNIKLFTTNAIDFNATYIKTPKKYNQHIINPYEQTHNTKGIKKLFNLSTEQNEIKRKQTYLTIVILIIIIVGILMIILNLCKQYIQKIHKIMLGFLFSYSIFFLSYTHGALGVSFSYPLVNLEYKIDDKVHKIKNIILLENNMKRVLLLNRLDYMKIIEIPYSNILVLEQKAIIELFKNCSKSSEKEKKVELCEESFY